MPLSKIGCEFSATSKTFTPNSLRHSTTPGGRIARPKHPNGGVSRLVLQRTVSGHRRDPVRPARRAANKDTLSGHTRNHEVRLGPQCLAADEDITATANDCLITADAGDEGAELDQEAVRALQGAFCPGRRGCSKRRPAVLTFAPQVVRRKAGKRHNGYLYIICKSNPRHKQRQGS